jgi:hypothetical protein
MWPGANARQPGFADMADSPIVILVPGAGHQACCDDVLTH